MHRQRLRGEGRSGQTAQPGEHLWHKYKDQSLDPCTQVQAGVLSFVPGTPALRGRDRKVSGAGTHMSYKLRKKPFCHPSRAGSTRGRHSVPSLGFYVFLYAHRYRVIKSKILMSWFQNTEKFQDVSQIISLGIRV